MSSKQLHITNGSVLTNYLETLDFSGDFITWEEMLCEGPTEIDLISDFALQKRCAFFSETYNIEFDIAKFKAGIDKLNQANHYDEIVLWFEYDLFCHLNMAAVITLITQKKISKPLSLVCSGRVKGKKNLCGLAELSSKELKKHYDKRITLTEEDIDYATTIWQIYCGRDHNLLKPYIVKSSSFKYMSNCLKAHLERFPDSVDGLNILERNILEIVRDENVHSKHHLLGYALNYQGFYGFGDLQIERLIDKLSIFILEESNKLELNRKGHEALLGQHNFFKELNNNLIFGGVEKHDFQFNKKLNKLIKTV